MAYIPIMVLNNYNFLILDTIKELKLSTHSDSDCGGYKLRIEIIQGFHSCYTYEMDEFSSGDTLKWSGSNKMLGDCRDFEINTDEMLRFKMKTFSYNDFCPEVLHVKLENGVVFESVHMEHWHDQSDNEQHMLSNPS